MPDDELKYRQLAGKLFGIIAFGTDIRLLSDVRSYRDVCSNLERLVRAMRIDGKTVQQMGVSVAELEDVQEPVSVNTDIIVASRKFRFDDNERKDGQFDEQNGT